MAGSLRPLRGRRASSPSAPPWPERSSPRKRGRPRLPGPFSTPPRSASPTSAPGSCSTRRRGGSGRATRAEPCSPASSTLRGTPASNHWPATALLSASRLARTPVEKRTVRLAWDAWTTRSPGTERARIAFALGSSRSAGTHAEAKERMTLLVRDLPGAAESAPDLFEPSDRALLWETVTRGRPGAAAPPGVRPWRPPPVRGCRAGSPAREDSRHPPRGCSPPPRRGAREGGAGRAGEAARPLRTERGRAAADRGASPGGRAATPRRALDPTVDSPREGLPPTFPPARRSGNPAPRAAGSNRHGLSRRSGPAPTHSSPVRSTLRTGDAS